MINTKPERVFSGIQPSGEIHLGNYLGAIKKWVEITETNDSIFCIVDDHAITVEYEPAQLTARTFDATLATMACGLDPNKCTIFIQSHVPEHTELTWLFNTITPLGSLFRMTQFKEKNRNALHKAIGKKGGGKNSALYQLKKVGETMLAAADSLREDVASINPEGGKMDNRENDEIVSRLNDGLGNLLQQLQVGLGVSAASTGLFDYPVLQAADIMLYKATLVPVGEDQEQHLELCREVAERFNRRFGEVFPMVKRLPGEAPRILGLDGKQKMSKSLGNHIGILDSPEVVLKKLGSAFTDPNRIRKSDPGRPRLCNVFSLHKFFTAIANRDEIEEGCLAGKLGCFDCKKILATGINEALAPIQARSENLKRDPKIVIDVIHEGSKRCRAIASTTMEEVRDRMGIGRNQRFDALYK
jgi:tryptophanyl-tRNA synthetase